MGVPDEFWICFLIMVGFFLKLVYDIKVGYTAPTPYAGVWEYLPEGAAHEGHIGYIQYIFTYHALPDRDMRTLAAYSNPPLFYLYGALVLEILHRLMRWAVGTSLHCIQCINVIFVMVGECCCLGILRKLGVKGRKIVFMIVFLFFFPPFYHLSAAFNGGAMTFMLSMLSLNSALSWYNSRRYKTLVTSGIELGLGLMTSFTAVIVLPMILLVIRNGIIDGRRNEVPAGKQVRTFFLTAGLMGIWWPLYRLIRFGIPFTYVENPGVRTTGSFLSRLNLPTAAMLRHIHTVGNADLESNIWAQTFKTAIFDFNSIHVSSGVPRALALFMLYASIAVCIVAHIMLFYSMIAGKTDSVHRHLMEGGYLIILAGYLLLCYLVPMTGIMDAKQLVLLMLIPAAGAGLCGRGEEGDNLFEKIFSVLFNFLMLIIAVLSAFLFGFYY